MRAQGQVGSFAYRGALCVSIALLAACTKPATETTAATPSPAATLAASASSEAETELKWARLALARNPTLEIIATDTTAGVFTVRFKNSGEIRAVKPSDLVATPLTALTGPLGAAQDRQVRAAETPAAAPMAQSASPAQPMAASGPAASAAPAGSSGNYTIERADGQLKVSGPGVSIVSSGPQAVAATAGAAPSRGADPIICEGRRMLHFDNRNIYVEGDAIIARGGCELYITNSRVVADGTGVVVRDAIVHISNSTIEGGAASFDASDAAKVYLRGSTFQGLPRRSQEAVVQDQGGNQWR
jgi:hypothetical protein